MRMPAFEIFRGLHEDHWYWHLKAANGEIVCVSERFPSKANAKRAAKRARVLSCSALIKGA